MRPHAGSVRGQVQRAGSGENGVANRFTFEALHPHVRKQPVVRIHLSRPLIRDARQAIRVRQHHLAVHRFHRPAAFAEAPGQVVEKLRVRWPVAGLAEIVDRPHQSLAEMMLPDAVHHDARGQRIIRTEQRLGQFQASAAIRIRRRLVRGQHVQKSAGSLSAWIEVIAAQVDAQVVRLVFGGNHPERLHRERLFGGGRQRLDGDGFRRVGGRLFRIREDDPVDDDMAIGAAVGDFQVTELADLFMQRNRLPPQKAVAIARHALRVSPVGKDSDGQQRGVLSDRGKFGSRQPYMDVRFGGDKASRRERAHELVRSAPKGVGHARARARGKSQTVDVPAFEGRLAKVLEHDVAGPFGMGGFSGGGIVRHRHPAEDCLGFLILGGRLDGAQHYLRAFEDAAERIVIGRRDRIELVIVAAGAGDGQAEERLAEDVDLVVHFVGADFAQIGRRIPLLAEPEKAGPERRSQLLSVAE